MTPDEEQPRNGAGNADQPTAPGRDASARHRRRLRQSPRAQTTADPDLVGITARVRGVEDMLNEEGRRLLVPLFGAVALVFVIACANVAGLLLSRGLQRQQEYAMRSALGAGRGRLFRQVITESVVLSLVGAALGAVVAIGIVAVLKSIGGHAVPRADAVSVGWPVFAFGWSRRWWPPPWPGCCPRSALLCPTGSAD